MMRFKDYLSEGVVTNTIITKPIELSGKRLTSILDAGDYSNVVLKENFYCSNNQLTDLKGAPKEVEEFYCLNNNLTSLEGIPETIHYTCDIRSNELTSLHNIHKQLKSCKKINYSYNYITECILGLKLIKNLDDIVLMDNSGWPGYKDLKRATMVIADSLHEPDDDVMEVQEQLIQMGLKRYAKL